jgi:hypothetical protein
MAQEHVQIIEALTDSKTWGEFRRRMPPKEYAQLIKEHFSADGEQMDGAEEGVGAPPDDAPFSSGEIPGVEDAEYPHAIIGIQDSILPPEVVQTFAEREGHFNCNTIWRISVDRRDEVIAALSGHGFDVVERQDLEFF